MSLTYMLESILHVYNATVQSLMDTLTCSGKGDGGNACHKDNVPFHPSNHWTSTISSVISASCCLAVVNLTTGEAL